MRTGKVNYSKQGLFLYLICPSIALICPLFVHSLCYFFKDYFRFRRVFLYLFFTTVKLVLSPSLRSRVNYAERTQAVETSSDFVPSFFSRFLVFPFSRFRFTVKIQPHFAFQGLKEKVYGSENYKRCGAWAFMAQKQHYSWWYIEERLFEILASDNLEEELEYCREELFDFQYWLSAERFDRHAVNCRLRR